MKSLKYYIFLFLLLPIKIFSQSFVGLAGDSYNIPVAMNQNPSLLADNKSIFTVNLIGVGADIQNNFLSWDFPYSIINTFTGNIPKTYKNASNELVWLPDYLKLNSTQTTNATVNGLLIGPSLTVKIKPLKASVSVGLNYNANISMSNSSKVITDLIVRTTADLAYQKIDYPNKKFNFNTGMYKEYFLSYGQNIFEDEEKKLKIGATIKYLVSNNFLNMQSNDISFVINPSVFNPNRQAIAIPEAHGSLAYSNGKYFQPSIFGEAFNFKGLGSGWAASIGFNYEFLDQSKNSELENYKFKFGAAINNIGKLFYKSPTDVEKVDINGLSFSIQPNTYNSIGSLYGMYNTTKTVFTNGLSNTLNKFNIGLPSTLNAFFDYALKAKVYVNLNAQYALTNASQMGYKSNNFVSISPRFETMHLMFALPVSITNNLNNINLGLSARILGFYFGTNNTLALVNNTHPTNFSVYSGVFIPIYPKEKKLSLDCYYPDGAWKKPKKGPVRNFKSLFK